MDTAASITPQGFRTAAYVEAKARMDFVRSGKTRKGVKCNPPNTKCGGRCIPPQWDCRLKGEGADPKLRAVKLDPVGGLANLQRGTARFFKGLQRGNFSEIEGGKRALIRGTVKLTPGDLKKKEEFRTWLEQNFIRAGVGIAVLGGAGGLHFALKRSNAFGYRYGAGKNIDDAAERGVNAVLDLVPVWGAERRRVRNTGIATAGEVGQRVQRTVQEGPEALNRNLGTGSESLLQNPRSVSPIGDGKRALTDALGKVNREAKDSTESFYNWNQKHREAFWGAKRDGNSIYSETATNEFLADLYRMPASDRANSDSIKYALERQIQSEQIKLLDLARQEGYRIQGTGRLKTEDAADFARRVVARTKTGNAELSQRQQLRIRRIVTSTPFTAANDVYRETQRGFDDYFAQVSKLNQVTAGAPLNSQQRQQGVDSVIKAGDTRRAELLLKELKTKGTRVAGPSHVELISTDYYHTRVVGTPKAQYPITDRLAKSAAAELTGRTDPIGVQEAFEILNQKGYRVTPVQRQKPSPSRTKPVPRKLKSRAQLIEEFMEEGGYTRETAERMADDVIQKRGDEQPRTDTLRAAAYLETRARLDKRCGKSGIADNKKCSKTTGPQSEASKKRQAGKAPGLTCFPPNQQCGNLCIPPTATCHVRGSGGAKRALNTGAKIAAVAGGAAAVIGTVRNRKIIRRVVKKTNSQVYRNTYGRVRVGRRVANNVIRSTAREVVPKISKKVVKTLSQKNVTDGISRLPKEYQERANRLVGDAKVVAAHIALKSQGGKIRGIDTSNNFSSWEMGDGTLLTTGSVKDSLLIYNSKPQESIGGARTYSTQFRINGEFDAKSSSASKNALQIAKTVRKMFDSQVDMLPDNSIIYAVPYAADAKGRQRKSIYQKYGFQQATSGDERLWAIKTKGRFTKMSPEQLDQIKSILEYDNRRGDATEFRFDKKCGKSGIPDTKKCHKQTSLTTTTITSNNKNSVSAVINKATTAITQNKELIAKVAGGVGAVGGVGILAAMGVQKGKIARYRKNVARSAVEAEKLALEYERTFKLQAASRLRKKVEDVTGFEASVYNFKDKGQDRGFGGPDNDPAWFGQTRNSRGAVVMLSYADDNRFTTRGQGSYQMASRGAFQQIWGDRDILPYANNISQPTDSPLDDIQVKQRKEFLDKVGNIAGSQVKGAVKSGLGMADSLKRFEFLRKNVDERGFNPDAMRAAAFVVAQRRLTGKSVDIMSYSNGGNVATETLAILKEMGYRDVKVVNIAGPTFGIFEHSRDNMRTWVSEGDSFYTSSKGLAYQGGNTQLLDNPNIPHGLMEKTDPNNQEFGAQARANIKAKNSYLLDEQLRREAYTFLTVDKQRSRELVDEIVWRASEDLAFEGDLAALYGDASTQKLADYKKSLFSSGSSQEAKNKIRDEVEERMLEVWYGGYDPKKIKKAQDGIRAELATQVSPKKQTVRPRRPLSLSERVNNLMEQNPGMSREAARKQAQRDIRTLKTDAYDLVFNLTLASLRHRVA